MELLAEQTFPVDLQIKAIRKVFHMLQGITTVGVELKDMKQYIF